MNNRLSTRRETINDLSDDELRNKLYHYGFPNIPVTETTRKILIQKLQYHMNRAILEKQCNRRTTDIYTTYDDIGSISIINSKTSNTNRNMRNKHKNIHNLNKCSPSVYRAEPQYSHNNDAIDIPSSLFANDHLRSIHVSPRISVPPPIMASDSEEDSDSLNYSPCIETRTLPTTNQRSFLQTVNIRQYFYNTSYWLLCCLRKFAKNGDKSKRIEYSFFRKKNNQKLYLKDTSYPNENYKSINYFNRIISCFSNSLKNQNEFNQTIIPYLLLSMFLIFLSTVSVIYIWISLNYNNNNIDLSNPDYTLCPYIEKHYQMESQVHCIEKEYIQEAIVIVKLLHSILYKRSNHCSNNDKDKEVSIRDIIEHMYQLNSEVDTNQILKNVKNAQYLIKKNSHWNIYSVERQNIDEFQERTVDPIHYEKFVLLKSRLPLSCTLHNKLQAFFIIIGTAFLFGLCMLMINVIYNNLQRRRTEKIFILEDVTNRIIDELVYMASKSHSSNENCSVTISHLRDKVIPIYKRKEFESAWNDAIRNLELKDNRIMFGIKLRNGEECRTIKWIAGVGTDQIIKQSATKQWQSPAFNTTNKIINPPTPCLKIRQMFDYTEINNPNLHQIIQDSILEKVGRRCNVYDIQIDTESCCVYVRCASEKDAGIVHNAINGWWFDKRLVSIKFLRLQRYLARFPQSKGGPTCLLPSNSKNLSMSEFNNTQKHHMKRIDMGKDTN